MPFFPVLVLLLLPCPALPIAPGADPATLSPPKMAEPSRDGDRRAARDVPQPIKVLISATCVQKDQELELEPGSPLVLTHRISLVPAPGACGGGCEEQVAAFRERVERLEREVSMLTQKCGGTEGGCCTSQQSTGAHCTIQPSGDSCPSDCSDQGRCEGGRCVCFPGFSGPDCSSVTCPSNCSHRGRCMNGQCVCDSGFTGTDCSERACPNNCNDKGRCVNGRCVCDTGFTGPDCSERACPNDCNDKGRCVNGRCVCDTGFTGPDCSAKSCPNSCRNKGRCVDGRCVCDSGFTGPDCVTKSCPGNCHDQGRCVNGQCVCDSGFTGPDCSAKPCPNNCRSKGRCVKGRCVCDTGFTGTDCSAKTCPNNCNDQGRCVNGQCVCDSGLMGPDCSAKSCPNNCRSKGRCVDGRCVCDSGFTGPDCATKSCPGNCHDQGRCVNGKCVCDTGFTGPDCSAKSCPNSCRNKGRCVNGKCVCDSGFTGPDCSAKSCPSSCRNKGRCVDGKCVCDSGFTGPDCSAKSCPSSCRNKGRCVDGRCVCDSGFTGPDCATKSCPGNCQDQGRCVNGGCVCDTGFTGLDCSERACPNNCHDQGRCVNGQCVCDTGFTGPDCSAKTCSNNCRNKGRCVDGRCVCDSGFTGPDCATKSCPGNCQDQGQCVNGECVCEAGFTGPDCSQCEEGLTGADCSTRESFTDITVLSGVTRLGSKNITDSSVTLFWTSPSIQYERYLITFTSQKEGDQTIISKVQGWLTSYTQTGLAAGQEYVVSIRGEKDGKTVAESTIEFTTSMSGPKNLRVVKTTTSSVVVQWEPPLADIDRYRLSVSTNRSGGGAATTTGSQELTLPPERDSAHVEGLEAGRLYDITLVAEMGRSQSRPVTVQATPALPPPVEKAPSSDTRVTMETLSVTTETEVDRQQGRAAGKPKPNRTVFYKRKGEEETERRKVWRGQGSGGDGNGDRTKVDSPARVQDKRKDGVGSKQTGRLVAPGKPKVPGPARFDSTRVGQGGKKPVPVWQKRPGIKHPGYGAEEKTKPKHPAIGNETASQADRGGRRGVDANGPGAGIDRVEDDPPGGSGSRTPAGSVIQANSGSKSTVDSGPVDSGKGTEPSTGGAGEEVRKQTAALDGDATHANGKKCVKKVKVGYRTANGTVWVSGTESVAEGGANGRGGAKAGGAGGSERGGSGVGSDGVDAGMAREGGNEHEPRGDQLADVRAQGRLRTIETDPEHPFSDLLTTPPLSLLLPFGQPNGGSQTYQPKGTGAEEPQTYSETTPSFPPNLAPSVQSESDSQRRSGSLGPEDDWASPEAVSMATKTDAGPETHDQPSGSLGAGDGWGSLETASTATESESAHRSSIPDGAMGSGKEGGKDVGRGEEGRIEAEVEGREGGPLNTRHPGPKAPPRRRPLTGPFHNRTRLSLGAPHHPSRGPYRRPVPPRTINRTGLPTGTRRVLPSHQGKQSGYEPGPTSAGSRMRPGEPALRTNGSEGKTRQSYTKTGYNGTSTRVGPDPSASLPERAGSGSTVPRAGPGFASVGVRDVTSRGFTLIWAAPHGIYRNFTVTRREHGGTEETDGHGRREESQEEEDEDEGSRGKAGVGAGPDESRGDTDAAISPAKAHRNTPKSTQVLPGSTRSLPFQDLAPQTRYTLTLTGSGPRLRSKIHQLNVTTGPEPPSDLSFSNVTASSVTVSWTKPKRPVSGFKVTYTHGRDGEPLSVDSQNSNVLLSQLSPGSSYAVSVISLLGLDESDPIKGIFATLPDPPTDLRAINVTDAKALLLWRPALAAVDRYIIVYASEEGSAVTITVSGNAAEQQLKSLQGSTIYTVTITSQLGGLQSAETTNIFTTLGGIDQVLSLPGELTASDVTPRSAVLSWTPPQVAVTGYKLTYQTAGEEMREVTLDPGVTQYKLTRLFSMSKYTVHLHGERRGKYTAAISTQFTTGTLRYPFPTDCSQELLNGFQESGEMDIFPGGKPAGAVPVYCDMEAGGGGWTVFQRRKDGGTDFFRRWREYSSGFGDLSGEFWLGNELLHNLTSMVPMALRVDLRAGAESVFAQYSSFSVGTQRQHYLLRVSGYSGTAGDSLSYHDRRPFSTKDRDPRPFITRCAMSYKGGWWYRNCHEANLNGLYDTHTKHQGVIWTSWKNISFSIPFTEMKMRPASFTPQSQG